MILELTPFSHSLSMRVREFRILSGICLIGRHEDPGWSGDCRRGRRAEFISVYRKCYTR